MTEVQLYNGKYKLQFSEGSHRYKVNGEYKPGVTTMLKLIDKGDMLGQWMVNMALEAIQNGKSLDEAKYAWRVKRDTAGDVGHRVHAWIEAYTSGKTLPIDADMANAVDAYKQWERQNNINHLHSERLLYSEKYDYCGTVDDVHEQNGLRVVNDYKTGKPDYEYNSRTKQYTGKIRARIEHFLQDALYDQCMIEEDGKGADKYAVTYITKEGKLHYFETDKTEELRKLALCIVEAYGQLKTADFNNKYTKG